VPELVDEIRDWHDFDSILSASLPCFQANDDSAFQLRMIDFDLP
jgi:hypothetical protein